MLHTQEERDARALKKTGTSEQITSSVKNGQLVYYVDTTLFDTNNHNMALVLTDGGERAAGGAAA